MTVHSPALPLFWFCKIRKYARPLVENVYIETQLDLLAFYFLSRVFWVISRPIADLGGPLSLVGLEASAWSSLWIKRPCRNLYSLLRMRKNFAVHETSLRHLLISFPFKMLHDQRFILPRPTHRQTAHPTMLASRQPLVHLISPNL